MHLVSALLSVDQNFQGDLGAIGPYVGDKNWTQSFFPQTSGRPRIFRQNPGISRIKSLISLVSRDIRNYLALTPSRGRPLPHRVISGFKSLGLCSFFMPEYEIQGRSVAGPIPWCLVCREKICGWTNGAESWSRTVSVFGLWFPFVHSTFAIGPAPHRVSQALRARNPRRVRKEYPGAGPQKCRKSAPRSLKRVRKESKVRF